MVMHEYVQAWPEGRTDSPAQVGDRGGECNATATHTVSNARAAAAAAAAAAAGAGAAG